MASNAFVNVRVTNLEETQTVLKNLKENLENMTPMMEAIGKEVKKFFSGEVFESEGGALGQKWQPLKQSTYDQKTKKYPGRLMLEREGTLRKSFFYRTSPMSVFISNNAKTPNGESLFAIHQLGTSHRGFGGAGVGRGRNLPARPMIGVNERVKTIIATIVNTEVEGAIKMARR